MEKCTSDMLGLRVRGKGVAAIWRIVAMAKRQPPESQIAECLRHSAGSYFEVVNPYEIEVFFRYEHGFILI